MSHLPLEIILLILKHLVPLLSVEESLQLRHVNTLFANEIQLLLFRNPTSDQENLILQEWHKCPEKSKRQYVRTKIGLHGVRRCLFSRHAHEMLQTKLAHTSFAGVPFIERIVDIGCFYYNQRFTLFNADLYDEGMAAYTREVEQDHDNEWEPIEETALAVLACSAIVRHDVGTLLLAIKSGFQFQGSSERLQWSPLCIAAWGGSKEIATIALDQGCIIQLYKKFGKRYVLLDAAAQNKQMGVLEVWLDHLQQIKDEHLQFNVDHLMRMAAMRQEFTKFHFLSRWFRGDIAALLYNTLIQAIGQEEQGAVTGILKHGEFDRTMWTEKYPKGPIFTIMLAPWNFNSMPMLERVLRGGIKPDGRYPGVNGTPLQRAIEKGSLDIASKLTSYGADVNACCAPHRMHKRSKVPMLLLAARKRNTAMVRLLLDKGADPTSVTNDKAHGRFIQKIVDRREADLTSASAQNDA
ncbi:ankyrin repeat domain-containing protein [Aspergillus melleus]|uniref:ankyrin repeat domain-containing protein n=1 Tax=Aspergillus melleus TaxID=138277 RepID=UPI001E8E8B93|nr:uncharacterized protein LDX57_010582 [Aspergillus melleus]KAH8432948.1 hypothetical protein LDX57_010582 [Aspergillus melleus]